jgi:hypothetical protein
VAPSLVNLYCSQHRGVLDRAATSTPSSPTELQAGILLPSARRCVCRLPEVSLVLPHTQLSSALPPALIITHSFQNTPQVLMFNDTVIITVPAGEAHEVVTMPYRVWTGDMRGGSEVETGCLENVEGHDAAVRASRSRSCCCRVVEEELHITREVVTFLLRQGHPEGEACQLLYRHGGTPRNKTTTTPGLGSRAGFCCTRSALSTVVYQYCACACQRRPLDPAVNIHDVTTSIQSIKGVFMSLPVEHKRS